MTEIRYPARFKTSKSGITITFPDFDEAISEARIWQEAMANAEEVLTLTIEGRLEDGEALPSPKGFKGAVWVAPSAKAQAAMLFRAHRGDVTTADLQRRLSTSSWSRVVELERAANVTLDRADRAARALGFRLVLAYEPTTQVTGDDH
jgi:antitoxin HicB